MSVFRMESPFLYAIQRYGTFVSLHRNVIDFLWKAITFIETCVFPQSIDLETAYFHDFELNHIETSHLCSV